MYRAISSRSSSTRAGSCASRSSSRCSPSSCSAFQLQTREVYRVLADDFPNQHWQVAFGFVGLLLASGFIWHCGRAATLAERRHALPIMSIEGALLRWMPRLLAALVPLGASLGLYTTIREAQTTASLVKSGGCKTKLAGAQPHQRAHRRDANPPLDRDRHRNRARRGGPAGDYFAHAAAAAGSMRAPGRWLVGKETTTLLRRDRRRLHRSVLALAAGIGAIDRRCGNFCVVPGRARGRLELPPPARRPARHTFDPGAGRGRGAVHLEPTWNDNHRVAIVASPAHPHWAGATRHVVRALVQVARRRRLLRQERRALSGFHRGRGRRRRLCRALHRDAAGPDAGQLSEFRPARFCHQWRFGRQHRSVVVRGSDEA